MTIKLDNIDLWQGNKLLFSHFTWSLVPQQWTCLLGRSGIGKSSLLRFIAGLIPQAKQAHISSRFLSGQELSYMGQNDALLPWLTVFENAALSTRLGPYSRKQKANIRERVAYLLQQTGLEGASGLYPRQLSGGMRQRVALVRTLAEDKSVILMDEPFSHLDAFTRHQLQNLAAKLLKNKTVLFVTHDPAEALRLADRIDLLYGCPAQVKTLVQLATPAPRDLHNLELMRLQNTLYQALSDSDELTLKTAIGC